MKDKKMKKNIKKCSKKVNYQFKLIKKLNIHNDIIISILIFPSGNLISLSNDKSIKIWDNQFNLLHCIEEENPISFIDIKNDNNYISCSTCFIKIWIKNNNKFEINEKILDVNNSNFIKIKYYLNDYIISSSCDKTIKILKNIYDKYQYITIIKFYELISFLLLEDTNILITSGYDKTTFWNMNTFEIIFTVENFKSDYFYYFKNSICKLDKDRIIIVKGNDYILKVISISKRKVIKQIDNQFGCYGVYLIKNKSIFLTYGDSDVIKIYKSDNYKLIYDIKYESENIIKGLIQFKNNLILSYLDSGEIQIWEIGE